MWKFEKSSMFRLFLIGMNDAIHSLLVPYEKSFNVYGMYFDFYATLFIVRLTIFASLNSFSQRNCLSFLLLSFTKNLP